MRNSLIVICLSLVAGCVSRAGHENLTVRENSFSAKAGPRCPGGMIAIVERRMMDDRYDCVDPEFFEAPEMVSYDDE